MFQSARLRLRAVEEEDYAVFHDWWSDPDLMALQSTRTIRLVGEPRNRAMFESWMESPDDGTIGFSIVERSTDLLIGFCSLWGATIKDRQAELAIGIGEADYRGKMYGPEAMRLLLAYAFGELNYHRVFLTVLADNEPAVRAYRKVGFVEEGRMRRSIWRDGRWKDQLLMAILQDEFPGRTT